MNIEVAYIPLPESCSEKKARFGKVPKHFRKTCLKKPVFEAEKKKKKKENIIYIKKNLQVFLVTPILRYCKNFRVKIEN